MLACAPVSTPTRILLDTDIGTDVDDAIALALILASPELDLRAVTTVSGDVILRSRIAKKLLTIGGKPAVPVAAGIQRPVLRQRNFLCIGHEGRGIVSPSESLRVEPAHAVDVLIDVIRRERPHVVCIGPLSNLAVAIMKEPDIVLAIPQLTVMGGFLGLHRDVPRVEYNFASDAEAAIVVLNAGIRTTIVPLDVTWQVALRMSHMALLRQSRSRLVHTLCDAIDVWTPIQQSFFGNQPGFDPATVALLHDPLTVAVLLEPSLVRFEHRRLRPALVDGAFELVADPSALEFEVAVAVDAARFVALLMENLLLLP